MMHCFDFDVSVNEVKLLAVVSYIFNMYSNQHYACSWFLKSLTSQHLSSVSGDLDSSTRQT